GCRSVVVWGCGDGPGGATAVPVHALAGAEPGASLPVASMRGFPGRLVGKRLAAVFGPRQFRPTGTGRIRPLTKSNQAAKFLPTIAGGASAAIDRQRQPQPREA